MTKSIKISPKLEQVLQQLGSVLVFEKKKECQNKTEETIAQSKPD